MFLYIVIAEGHLGRYGSEKYCLGVFTTNKRASVAMHEYFDQVREYIKKEYDALDVEKPSFEEYVAQPNIAYYYNNIKNVVKLKSVLLNETYHMNMIAPDGYWPLFENNKYLGGYVE